MPRALCLAKNAFQVGHGSADIAGCVPAFRRSSERRPAEAMAHHIAFVLDAAFGDENLFILDELREAEGGREIGGEEARLRLLMPRRL